MMKKIAFAIAASLVIAVAGINGHAEEVEDYKASVKSEVILPFDNAGYPDLSSDGSRIIFIRANGAANEIWTAASDGTDAKALLAEPGEIYNSPIWSHDDSKIFYLKNSDLELHRINADGTGDVQIGDRKYIEFNPQQLPDGKKIVLGLIGIDPPGIYIKDLATEEHALIYSTEGLYYLDIPFAMSPDGNTILILYKQELIFVNLDGSVKEKKTIKTELGGGEGPVWTPDGRYIILGKVIYDLHADIEGPFLPWTATQINEGLEPTYVGPDSITISKDGRKVAFMLYEIAEGSQGTKVKVVDLLWQ